MNSVATVLMMVTTAVALRSSGCAADLAPGRVAAAAAAAEEGPSLAEIARVVESAGRPSSFDVFAAWTDARGAPEEGRGKKPKPGQMAAVMGVSAGASMLMMKAITVIKLFIIHSFLATKLGLVIGAYLLACKLMEMKSMPTKKVVKWVSAPAHYGDHPPMAEHHPEGSAAPSPYEPHYETHEEQQPQPQHQQQQQPEQYGPPPPVHQFMPSGDFGGGGGGGGGDMQGHYSHISPVTYRPAINRNQPENRAKSVGRLR